MQKEWFKILDTSKQEQVKPSNKRMESSYYMALSDRTRNYEAIGTDFAFLAFFLEFLWIYEISAEINNLENIRGADSERILITRCRSLEGGE